MAVKKTSPLLFNAVSTESCKTRSVALVRLGDGGCDQHHHRQLFPLFHDLSGDSVDMIAYLNQKLAVNQ